MKKILFITGTRADFGKIKSLIFALKEEGLDVYLFVTGMHMLSKYGATYKEIEKAGFNNNYMYINHVDGDSMDRILANTVHGLGDYTHELQPDMIVVHGDRVEALAGAIVGSLNNILVSHIEGGEISGTIDELIRHSVSKLSHLHFVSNESAKKRLVQLGENKKNIFAIGSPDLDLMNSDQLPSLSDAKNKYNIDFDEFGIMIFHPVTTELDTIREQTKNIIDSMEKSEKNWIIIYPNNDHGSDYIFDLYNTIKTNAKFKFFPSIRFEYFLTLLRASSIIIGNSSCGVREAPFYGIPTLNIGTRQNGRVKAESVFNLESNAEIITDFINKYYGKIYKANVVFGDGKSTGRFTQCLISNELWATSKQKIFVDISNDN